MLKKHSNNLKKRPVCMFLSMFQFFFLTSCTKRDYTIDIVKNKER